MSASNEEALSSGYHYFSNDRGLHANTSRGRSYNIDDTIHDISQTDQNASSLHNQFGASTQRSVKSHSYGTQGMITGRFTAQGHST